jgi:HK97 family phage major capsid protein
MVHMVDVMALRRKQTKLKDEQKSIFDEALQRSDKKLVGVEERRIEDLTKQVRDIDAEIEIADRANAAEMRDVKIAPKGAPFFGPAKGKGYFEMFPETRSGDVMGGFRDKGEFYEVLRSGRTDPRIESRASANTGIPSEGGILCPSGIAQPIMDNAFDQQILFNRATVWPMSNKDLLVPVFDNLNSSAHEAYGFSIGWAAEGSTGTAQIAKLRGIGMVADKMTLFSEATREMIADGLGFVPALEKAMSSAIAIGMDNAFLNGTGAGMPLGLINADASITVAKEVGQVADTIVWENLVKMQARLIPGTIGEAIWIASETTMPQLMQLALMVGTGGIAVPMLTRNGDSWSLNGIPLYFSPHMPNVGDSGDIMLVVPRFYYIGLRQQLVIDQSGAPGFMRDSTVYRCVVRVTGQPSLPEPITLANSNTVSAFVKLAVR